MESMEGVPAGAKSLIGHHYGGTMSNTRGAPPISSIIGARSPGAKDWCLTQGNIERSGWLIPVIPNTTPCPLNY